MNEIKVRARGGSKLTVLNPMGYPPKPVKKSAAARIGSLDGKTIYLVDCRFDDSIELLKQVQGWFGKNMPSVKTKIVSLNNMYQKDDPKTWEEIKANGDAAIVGVGHCSTCAPAVTTHSMTLESKYGVPTVALHTHMFDKVVRSVSKVGGLPQLPQVFVPQPVMGKTADELRAYIEGKDPITGKPVMQEVVEGLTRALAEGAMEADRSRPRFLEPATEEELQQLFIDNYWTDMLPIVLPTEERVQEMLSGTSHAPDEVVAKMQPTHNRGRWELTVEQVAINAVMAGARPEYFPVILALCSTEMTARGSTSSSSAAMCVVNGPIRKEINMNCGIGALGPYNHANATIGRAYGLASGNGQGGSVPGETYMGSQGNNMAYNSCTFAENEERSPWEPLHVQKGFKKDESAVSVFWGMRSASFCLGLRKDHWRAHVITMLNGIDPNTPPVFVLDPITARQFVERGGFDTKEKLIHWAWENAKTPAAEYWDLQLIQNYIYPRATFGEEPYASKLKAAPDELINTFVEGEINVVVVGGETNGYWSIQGTRYNKTVSIDKWR